MSEKRIAKYTREELESLPDDTDVERLDAMSDDDIDYSDNPATDAAFWAQAQVKLPEHKKGIYIRLDQDVLEWLKSQGAGYQTRINAVLRQYMDAQRSGPSGP